MKRVIDMKLDHQVYFDFVFELDEEENEHINAISFSYETGQAGTIIDYIDSILKDPSNETKYVFHKMEDLKEVLIDEYNGKKASELIGNN